MGLLSTIISKVFGKKEEPAAPQQPAAAAVVTQASPVAEAAQASMVEQVPEAAPAAPHPDFDVAAYLDGLAKANPEDLDWKKSIVDLMKLVGMDSSLSARKELAKELDYTGDTGDSASMNIWLHKQVLQKIAANGGKLPADLLD